MQSMSDKELDQLFQSRFESFEAEPAASLWSSIESQLDHKPGKRTGMSVFWMAAASVVVLLGAGLWLFRPEEKVYLKGNSVLTKVQEKPEESTPADMPAPAASAAAETAPAETRPEGRPIRVSKPVEYLAAANRPEPVREPEPEAALMAAEEPVTGGQAATVMTMAAAAEETPHTRRGEVHQTVLAMLPPEDAESAEQPLRERRKIRSVGDFVNFVVAKVDQREDKLIELADDDEGTKISGINLGLFKIKSKKR